jgi:hypothetical protein
MASGPFVADIDMMIDREVAPTSAVEGDHRFSHL